MTRNGDPRHGSVDTHGQIHQAAVIDSVGRQFGDREFSITPAGYRQLLSRLREHEEPSRVGVEGTGAYGALWPDTCPSRRSRWRGHPARPQGPPRAGKSHPLDAYASARAALHDSATGVTKQRKGQVEVIRALWVAWSSAVKARTQATNQLRVLLLTGPAGLRE